MRPVLISLLFVCGCAISDGDFLTTVVPGTLSAQLSAPAERFTVDGWLITSEDYELRLETLSLLAGELTIAGDLPSSLIVLPVMAEVPVATRIPGTALPGVPLSGCRPRCGLGPLTLTEGGLLLQHMRLHGRVRRRSQPLAPPLPEQVVDVDLRLAPPGSVGYRITQPLHMPLDRAVPEHLQLSAQLQVAADLGDAIEWSALPQKDGVLCLSRDLPACRSLLAEMQLLANLLHSSLALDFMQPQD